MGLASGTSLGGKEAGALAVHVVEVLLQSSLCAVVIGRPLARGESPQGAIGGRPSHVLHGILPLTCQHEEESCSSHLDFHNTDGPNDMLF